MKISEAKMAAGWNPYLSGALTGLLIILSAVVSGNYFGTSTAFVQVIGLAEKIINPARLAQLQYFKVVDPSWSWQILFVAGILIGSLLAAVLYGDFKVQFVPDLWKAKLGNTKLKRASFAFLGGIIAMIGARLAGGCPSGQMSAMILLSVSALIAMTMFFAVGTITARIIYRGGGR